MPLIFKEKKTPEVIFDNLFPSLKKNSQIINCYRRWERDSNVKKEEVIPKTRSSHFLPFGSSN